MRALVVGGSSGLAVTSTSAFTPRPNEPVYAAAKAGLGQLARSVAKDGSIGTTLIAAPAGMKETGFYRAGIFLLDGLLQHHLHFLPVRHQLVAQLAEFLLRQHFRVARFLHGRIHDVFIRGLCHLADVLGVVDDAVADFHGHALQLARGFFIVLGVHEHGGDGAEYRAGGQAFDEGMLCHNLGKGDFDFIFQFTLFGLFLRCRPGAGIVMTGFIHHRPMRNPESSGGGEHRGEDRPESSIEREGKPGLRLFRHTALLSPSNAQKVLETSVAVLSRECVDAASAAQELLTTESTLEIVMANAALLDRSTLHHLIVPLLESPDTFSKVIAAARRLPESTITADMVIDAWDKGISLATFSEDALDGLLAIMPAEQIWDQAIKNGGFDSILAFLDKFPKGSISKERYAVLAKVAGDLSYDEELLAHFENFPPGILRAESLLKRVRNESVVADQVANLLAELPSKEPILDWVRKHSAQSSFLIRFDRLPAGVFDIADFVDMNTYHGEAEFLDGIPKLPVGGVDTAQVVRDLLEAGMTSVVIRNLPKLQEGTFDKKALLARADEEHLLADVIPFLGVFSFEEIAPYEEKILKALLLPSSFVHLSVFESLLRNDSPSPSYEKLVDKCVNQYISPDDFERLFPFFKRYRTPVELFERLLSANNRPTARRVAELLIREGAIDASRFFALCRLHENFELGMEHIPDFLADEKAVKSFAFEAAFIPSYSLAKFIDVFPAGTVLPGPLAAELSKQELPALQRNIERFPDSALTPDIVKQLQIDPVESVVEERYDLVRLWLKVQRPDERPHDFFAQSNAVRTVERLLGDGRIASAHRLAECLALTGAEIPSALRERLEAAVMPDEALPRERDEKTHVVHEEAAAFYVDSVISELLGRIMQAPDWRGRLDVRGRLAVEETKKAIARRTGEMKAWMREYLFAAVGGELENFYSSPLSWVGTDHEQLYRRAPKGRILDKIAAAAGTFLHPWWDKGYGGPKWAKIAEAAYALWASHAGEEALIDHVFDLEHNSGTVFDKNPGRVKGDDTVLKQVLDAKFAAETPADLLSAMAELTSPDLASELRQRYAVVRRAADALGIA